MQAEHCLEENQNNIPYEVDVVFAIHQTLLEPLTLTPIEQAAMQMLLQLPAESLYLSREIATVVTNEVLASHRNLRAMELLLVVLNQTEAEHPIQTAFETQEAYQYLLIYLGMTFKFYFKKLPGITIEACFTQRKHLSPS